ncbi:MAG: hypothetical protein WC117_01060 [Sphaerochaetaceae bacterium]
MPDEIKDEQQDEFSDVFSSLMDASNETPEIKEPVTPAVDEPQPSTPKVDAAASEETVGNDTDASLPPEKSADVSQPGSDDIPPADAAPEEDDDLEDLRKRAHGYDSMKGRLNKTQEQVRTLQERIDAMSSQPRQSAPVPPTPVAPEQSPSIAVIPDEIKDDVHAFQKSYPAYARMIEDGGAVGSSLRALVADYGPEVAAIKAQSIALESRMNASIQALQQGQTKTAIRSHSEKILESQKTLAEIATVGDDGILKPVTGKEAAYGSYFKGLDTWMRSLPFEEATHWMEVKKSGSTHEVNQLLHAYDSQSQAPSAKQPQGGQSRAAKAAAAGAIPNRGASLPKTSQAPDDFDGTFSQLLKLDGGNV